MEAFFKQVISQKNKTITDEIFRLLETDEDLHAGYLKLVSKKGRDSVNRQLGKLVKKHYGLVDDGRSYSPESILIKSHQKYK